MKCWERKIDILSVRRPQPHRTNPLKERSENENRTDKKKLDSKIFE